MKTYKLFVYGTLMSTEHHSSVLRFAKPLGVAATKATSYGLSNFGFYPAIYLDINQENRIFGELYEVDAATLAEIDALGAGSSFYSRVEIELYCGTIAYVYQFSHRPMPVGYHRGIEQFGSYRTGSVGSVRMRDGVRCLYWGTNEKAWKQANQFIPELVPKGELGCGLVARLAEARQLLVDHGYTVEMIPASKRGIIQQADSLARNGVSGALAMYAAKQKEEPTRYRHYHSTNPDGSARNHAHSYEGSMTLVAKPLCNSFVAGCKRYSVGFAHCQPQDNFSKGEGRHRALQRLTKDPHVITIEGEFSWKKLEQAIKLKSSEHAGEHYPGLHRMTWFLHHWNLA